MDEDKVATIKDYLISLLPNEVYNMLFERLDTLDTDLQVEIIEALFTLFYRYAHSCSYDPNTIAGQQIDEIFDLLDGWVTFAHYDGTLTHISVKRDVKYERIFWY